jgi:undecaprenyl-phosphate galactose phosphotransferase
MIPAGTGWKSAGARTSIQALVLGGADALAFSLAVLVGASLVGAFEPGVMVSNYKRLLATSLLVFVAAMVWFGFGLGHYTRRRPAWDELAEVSKVLLFLTVLSGAMIFALSIATRRSAFLAAWAVVWVMLPLLRLLFRRALDAAGLWRLRLVVFGAGENARSTAVALVASPSLGYQPVAAFAVPFDERLAANELDAGVVCIPIVKVREDVDAAIADAGAEKVAVALDNWLSPEAQALVQHLALWYPDVLVVPPLKGIPLIGADVQHVFGSEVLLLQLRNNLRRHLDRALKRIFDFSAALILLFAFAPLMLWAASRIRRESGSPILFQHRRVGRDGLEFQCFKFRSMYADAPSRLQALLERDLAAREEWERDFKLRNDPRVTPIGEILRRTSVDELPQLINVLKGDMSLVGPRPVVPDELARYGEASSLYAMVRPGMTGLWQVTGRNETTYAERIAMDAWYVRNWSLWYDLVILFKTVKVVLGREGAY